MDEAAPLETFRRIVGSLDYPMFVVTASDGRERTGCLVGFATQCSIEPVRFLVCLSKANRTHRVAQRSSTLGVHVLRDDQGDLAALFGELTGDDVDKFDVLGRAGGSWHERDGGAPIIAGCDWFEGPILERVDLGDHEGQVLAVVRAGHEHPDGPQLGYRSVRDLDAGHEA